MFMVANSSRGLWVRALVGVHGQSQPHKGEHSQGLEFRAMGLGFRGSDFGVHGFKV